MDRSSTTDSNGRRTSGRKNGSDDRERGINFDENVCMQDDSPTECEENYGYNKGDDNVGRK